MCRLLRMTYKQSRHGQPTNAEATGAEKHAADASGARGDAEGEGRTEPGVDKLKRDVVVCHLSSPHPLLASQQSRFRAVDSIKPCLSMVKRADQSSETGDKTQLAIFFCTAPLMTASREHDHACDTGIIPSGTSHSGHRRGGSASVA